MLLSIIIPVYNGEKYLRECLDSIVCQADEIEFEVLIINDASQDKTPLIIEKYQKNHPNILRIFHNSRNMGVSAARNKGLENACGKWVAFVDADDLLAEHFFEYIDERTDCDLILFDSVKFETGKGIAPEAGKNKEGTPVYYGKQDRETLLKAVLTGTGLPEKPYVNLNSPWAKLYRREFIEHYNLRFLEDVKIGEDLLFNVQALAHQKKIKYISEKAYCYRQHSESTMYGYRENFIEEDKLFAINLSEALKDLEVSKELRALVYNRALEGLVQCFRRQIFSKESKLLRQEKYALLDDILNQEPYRTAINKSGGGMELTWKRKVIAGLLRRRWYGAVALLFWDHGRGRMSI